MPAVLAVAAQLFGLYRPSPPPTDPLFPHLDKLEHGVAFFLPVVLVSLALSRTAPHRTRTLVPGRPAVRGAVPVSSVLLVAGVSVVHATLSEVVQGLFYRHRSGDVLDALADVTGVAAGTVVALRLVGDRSRRRGGS